MYSVGCSPEGLVVAKQGPRSYLDSIIIIDHPQLNKAIRQSHFCNAPIDMGEARTHQARAQAANRATSRV